MSLLAHRALVTRTAQVGTQLRAHLKVVNKVSSRNLATKSDAPSTFRKAVKYGCRGGLIALQVGVVAFLASAWMHNHPEEAVLGPVLPEAADGRKRVVILGTGWGATSLVKSLDPREYEVVIVSPRNYFLFTPLLPSCTVGTLEHRSIMESIRYITRHKQGRFRFVEGECTKIDPENKKVIVQDKSELHGATTESELKYDYLVIGVGAETATFGIPGVKEHACFLKEIWDAKKIRSRLSSCIESAAFSGQDPKEQERLLHMVVVGGGPTGVEYAGELYDYLDEDLRKWYPEIADKFRITLIEAHNNVLASFSKELISYTESTFKDNKINVRTQSVVKGVSPTEVTIKNPQGEIETLPYGLLVWAAGNTARPVVRDLMAKFPELQTCRRGLSVDDKLRMLGADNIFVLGDASASKYAPTAQVANQQGKYLAKVLSKVVNAEDPSKALQDIKPFEYTHNGSLAYIGSEKAIADLPLFGSNYSTSGPMTYLFWKSAYLSNLFSVRNASLVLLDWTKKFAFGRDIARE
ncbi:NADH:ubiquinone oxidoreductase [Entomophthora muscae]|uniref:NADH:ubiquinone oxidoreductase n=1 Tax=Entomophthora muscae TaxID=34485 RepID=A0ACC2STX4_9FUNG|nr:NADH:ubiquinone oxidoreductase [Entomophthora muscae]